MSDHVYCYPGTNVLINKLDIHDADILHDAERDATAIRILQLYKHPIQGRFGYAHLKRIHRYIFQDIYGVNHFSYGIGGIPGNFR